jgi:putative tryptophan/tyrosine transport system substrate-binding protein
MDIGLLKRLNRGKQFDQAGVSLQVANIGRSWSSLKRREFITLLGGLSAAWPVVSYAQQLPRLARLGVLIFSAPQADPQMKTVGVRLRELGYIEGQNLIMIYRYAEGKYERLAHVARELIDERPDLVLALGGDVAPYATKPTSTTPIAFISIARPGEMRPA